MGGGLGPLKKASYHRGRWQVERERGQIADFTPPAPDRPARVLAEGVAAVLRSLQPQGQGWLATLAAEWPALVGADVARHTRPGGIERRTLLVYVDSSVWLSELQRFGQKRLLDNVRKRFAEARVDALRLRIDPDAPRTRA